MMIFTNNNNSNTITIYNNKKTITKVYTTTNINLQTDYDTHGTKTPYTIISKLLYDALFVERNTHRPQC